MLAARDISVRLGGSPVLEGVSLSVAPGEFVALLGPNGAGKSTLLRVLSGDLQPGTGTVAMNGRPLEAWPLREQALVRAVMPHQTSLVFAFTGEEVVHLGRTPHTHRATAAQNATAVEAALDAADAMGLAPRPFPALSAGERQRVALARALAQVHDPLPALGPRYLLLDEPTSNLDLGHQHAVMTRVAALRRAGLGVLAVMHDLNLAAQYADRIAVLHGGRVIEDGPAAQAITEATLRRVYGVSLLVIPHPGNGVPVVLPPVCTDEAAVEAPGPIGAQPERGVHAEEATETSAPEATIPAPPPRLEPGQGLTAAFRVATTPPSRRRTVAFVLALLITAAIAALGLAAAKGLAPRGATPPSGAAAHSPAAAGSIP